MEIAKTSRVTKVSTDTSRTCEHCDFGIRHEDIESAINHYIAEHGYKLLHVGSETTRDYGGGPWHTTAAILGCDDPPPLISRTITINLPDNGRG